MIIRMSGELEVDLTRGVIYFHAYYPDPKAKTVTPLRICRIRFPAGYDPELDQLDLVAQHPGI